MSSSVVSFPLFSASAGIPFALSASTWSCIRLMSGEMTTAVPSIANAGTW
ncbi:Uncharacterised protein [Segatella copri]|nr:Uncharacterised protein [Segatella copri]